MCAILVSKALRFTRFNEGQLPASTTHTFIHMESVAAEPIRYLATGVPLAGIPFYKVVRQSIELAYHIL